MQGKPESPLGTLRRAFVRLGAGLRAAWVNHLQAWLNADWFAGIKPLPPTMASKIAAVTIMGSIIVVSLVYGDGYHRDMTGAKQMASGEHPSQEAAIPAAPAEKPPTLVPGLGTVSASPSAAPTSQLPQMGEAFIDRFDGPKLHERWFVSDGWTNGNWLDNDWRKEQVSIGPNGLTLTMNHAPAGSTLKLASGEIRTHAFYRYGYFEARIKVPRDPGLVAAMFTYAHQEGKTRPNEIDIEILGRDPHTLEATIHESGKGTGTKKRLPFDLSDGFHTMGIEWQPGVVRWYADGQVVLEQTGPAAQRLSRPQQLIFNLLGSTQLKAWVGPIRHERAPWKMEIACAAYQPTYPGHPVCTRN